MDKPIIPSLMDTDFYKLTMQQLIFEKHAAIPTVFAFKNRTLRVKLAKIIDMGELREQLDHACTLRFSKSELHYLRGTNEYQERMFAEPYLEFLAGFSLPPYILKERDGQFELEFVGPWVSAMFWETFALSIVNELYYRALMKPMSRFGRECLFAEGTRRLQEKIGCLRIYPEITLCDFGTRRRFSGDHQLHINEVLAEEIPRQFLGTSNTLIAMKLGLLPMGTSAHEMYMVMSGIMHGSDEEIRASHNQVLKEWWDRYGYGLSVALTDTYGTDFFFRDMTVEQAHDWKGLRQDSGDPKAFGEKAIAFYEGHGIDPKSKLIVFSDGLNVDTITDLHLRFRGRIRTSFGWGTNLTNDLGLEPLSLVVKVIEANGCGAVKLSDNPVKAIGKPEDIERFKRIFGYEWHESRECVY